MVRPPLHSFHIPVMGLAYTIDSPIRVAQYGIDSVISIIDDEIIEKMKNFYSRKFSLGYPQIPRKTEDCRARRITAYLDMVDEIVNKKFEAFKEEISRNTAALVGFMEMLPQTSEVKAGFDAILRQGSGISSAVRNFAEKHLAPGSIDVNIMTKVDKEHFRDNEPLPAAYNDAHASLRGFAMSRLSSSLVLSAGMNPRLYSYLEEFGDFFPDADGSLRKKIILKVSDFRSAMIQGNFLAKKGLWVSEYRIESGLNCGGHAFATDGLLLGPILGEFSRRKEELITSAFSLMNKALEQKGKPVMARSPEMKITVQGGVGTAEEHDFLLKQYGLDSVGWGSPFLLVPEATSVDQETRNLLAAAGEKDFYLSNLSPLGVPFNTVRGTSNEIIRHSREKKNRYGNACPKKLLALSKEYDPAGLCTASRKYQAIKYKELEARKPELTGAEYVQKKEEISEKACLCVGLVNAAYLENRIEIKGENQGVVICPGPNLAYFDREVPLTEMVRHIYGYQSILADPGRPNLFINELKMYVDHVKKETDGASRAFNGTQIKKWKAFRENLLSGIRYYEELFAATPFFGSDAAKNDQLEQYRLMIEEVEIFQD